MRLPGLLNDIVGSGPVTTLDTVPVHILGFVCKRIHAEGWWSAELETRNFVLRVDQSLWAVSSSVIDVVRDALLC